MDEPDLGFDDAVLKLKEITEEKMKAAQEFTNTFMGDQDGIPETNQQEEAQQEEVNG